MNKERKAGHSLEAKSSATNLHENKKFPCAVVCNRSEDKHTFLHLFLLLTLSQILDRVLGENTGGWFFVRHFFIRLIRFAGPGGMKKKSKKASVEGAKLEKKKIKKWVLRDNWVTVKECTGFSRVGFGLGKSFLEFVLREKAISFRSFLSLKKKKISPCLSLSLLQFWPNGSEVT